MGELEKLDLLELMLAEDAAGVFSSGTSFGAEAGGPGGDKNGEFFFGNGFVAVQIVELDFGSGREPEVGVLDFEKVGGEFRELASAGEGGGVHQEGRQDFRVAVLAGVDVEKKIREGAFKAGAPAFVDRETRAGDFRGGGKIEDACPFTDFPMRFGSEIKFWGSAPAADFFVIRSAGAHGNGGVRKVGNSKQQVTLRGVQRGDALVGLLDAFGNQLHFGDQRVGVLLFFLEAGDFFTGFVPLRFEQSGRGDELAAFLVELAKSVQVERGTAVLRHFGENIQMVPKVIQVMHGLRRIPYSAWPL